MESCVEGKIKKLGYRVNTKPYGYIDTANMWYRNEIIDEFHKRTTVQGEQYEIDRMNFAKRGCADDANLCEIINISMGTKEQTAAVNEVLKDNHFDVMYRKQLELMSAVGTVAAYIRLKDAIHLDNGKVTGGQIRITYCNAENYTPLLVENDEVIEVCFSASDYVGDKKRTTMVMFTRPDGVNYRADTFVFDENGKEMESYWIILGDVKPFAVMRVAEVNNIRYMDGFGYPKVYGAIPTLKKIDLCNMILSGDLDKGEKIVLTNEALIGLDEETGQPKKKTSLMKKLFVFLGQKLPEQNSIIQEYNPQIRIDDITKTFELCLSLFSMTFGYGSKKYTFENGQIKTATEYIGERQDAMQELNKQRKEATDYITGIAKAVIWFLNTFQGTSYAIDKEVCVDYDDSYIEDHTTKMSNMRADALSFSEIPEYMIQYIMMSLNVDRDEAERILDTKQDDTEPEPED